MTQRRTDIDDVADDVLNSLETESYEAVAGRFHTSRGKIYSLAVAHRRRKHEARIRERAGERRLRQREFLQEVLNASATADVLDYLDGLPDDSVDLHLTSIPYNIGKRYGDSEQVDAKRFHYYVGWLLQVLSERYETAIVTADTIATPAMATPRPFRWSSRAVPFSCIPFPASWWWMRSVGAGQHSKRPRLWAARSPGLTCFTLTSGHGGSSQ